MPLIRTVEPLDFVPWTPSRREATIRTFRLYRCLIGIAAAILMVGCATWKDDSSVDSILAKAKSPPPQDLRIGESKSSIVLDFEFVNFDVAQTDADQAASIWQWVDETSIDLKLRGRFLSNGIRVGMVNNHERFRQRMTSLAADQDDVDEFLASASVASDLSRGKKQIPMRIGKRYELALRNPMEGSHVAMVRVDQNTIGRTLNNAQYMMAVNPIQLTGQKRVHLSLRTEIQHGELRQKYVGAEAAMRIVQQRDTWAIPTLDLDIEAAEGDTIVIAPTWPLTGLAKHMFSGINADNQLEQIVLLIRVTQVPNAIDSL
ncbi:hypothetical protein Poly51_05230 [Rubripirellula tenax]|uniref:Uncharacterized protein n=1 Tax=Rubripirellula tenax TaxID=2528015 RepID=A0A5C6FFR4_9BACT|nr:hypothetical protein [Rubripirellula tenax]TWU60248.1 hypothetical protein Poly51_05230 [Rubripirellula tenax]